jgi:uncharacterized protein involved in outer membrane biogenesis
MKKLIIRLLIALVVVVVLVVLAAGLFLDGAIKRGVETFGPRLTKVDIKLQSVHLSLFSGSGTVKGLVVGNPEGFKTPSAISVGTVTLALKPGSLLSDKIVITSINVQGPEITYETDLKHNNLSKILANVQEAAGGGQTEPAKPQESAQPKGAKPAKKLEVDEFIITGGKIYVSVTTLGGQAATIPLPDIHLPALGTGPDGITPAELTKKVLEAIEKDATQAASGAVADIGKGAVYLTKQAGGLRTNAVDKVTKGLGGFLKTK